MPQISSLNFMISLFAHSSYRVSQVRIFGSDHIPSSALKPMLLTAKPIGPTAGGHASIFNPCFSTMSNNLSAMPLGRLAPDSHFSIVDSLVLR